MDFTKPKHGKSARLKVNKPRPHQECELDEEEKQRFLQELRRICPSAGCLTKGDSDTDSASEDENLPPVSTMQCNC
ncbi:hypothetical protein DPMN_012106 [Dreissena polymorpha]|uniref:Uncharacterized protein n=1 Tax=Dreissena polymorpha TaxID=45954 RepID=A0A9D4N1R9_DREPO|nr:hypothetical protein DPMN_012106 [Dreissena polymorpha]